MMSWPLLLLRVAPQPPPKKATCLLEQFLPLFVLELLVWGFWFVSLS